MKNTIIFFCLFICSYTCFAQQSASSNSDPYILFNKKTLQLEGVRCKIVMYQVSLLSKRTGDMIGPYTYIRGKPSKDAFNLPFTAKPGDELYFEEIKAKGSDGRIRSIGSVKTKIE